MSLLVLQPLGLKSEVGGVDLISCGVDLFSVELNDIEAVVSDVLTGNLNVLHSSCAPSGNAALLS